MNLTFVSVSNLSLCLAGCFPRVDCLTDRFEARDWGRSLYLPPLNNRLAKPEFDVEEINSCWLLICSGQTIL